MDLYISALTLGAVGLLTMALGGLGRHGDGGKTHGQATTHGSGAGHSGAHGHSAAAHGSHGPGHGATHHSPPFSLKGALLTGARLKGARLKGAHAGGSLLARTAGLLTSPRVLFSFVLGFGTTGRLLQGQLGGVLLPAAAVAGGILFERLLVTPIWNFALRFASRPAQTLESAVLEAGCDAI